MNVSGHTILITGGASGIGLELVKQFHELGNTILITGRDEAKLEQAKAQFRDIHVYRSDVSDPAAIEKLHAEITEKFPQLNVLINNAGVARPMRLDSPGRDLETLTQEIDINFSGPVRMVAKFLPHLKRQPQAAIVNVSSALAFVPSPLVPVYSATKAALHSFTLSLRVQQAKTNVRIFELAPPATRTEMIKSLDTPANRGMVIMPVNEMVSCLVRAMRDDRFEVTPGQSGLLKAMSRIAPRLALKQMGKSAVEPPDKTT